MGKLSYSEENEFMVSNYCFECISIYMHTDDAVCGLRREHEASDKKTSAGICSMQLYRTKIFGSQA